MFQQGRSGFAAWAPARTTRRGTRKDDPTGQGPPPHDRLKGGCLACAGDNDTPARRSADGATEASPDATPGLGCFIKDRGAATTAPSDPCAVRSTLHFEGGYGPAPPATMQGYRHHSAREQANELAMQKPKSVRHPAAPPRVPLRPSSTPFQPFAVGRLHMTLRERHCRSAGGLDGAHSESVKALRMQGKRALLNICSQSPDDGPASYHPVTLTSNLRSRLEERPPATAAGLPSSRLHARTPGSLDHGAEEVQRRPAPHSPDHDFGSARGPSLSIMVVDRLSAQRIKTPGLRRAFFADDLALLTFSTAKDVTRTTLRSARWRAEHWTREHFQTTSRIWRGRCAGRITVPPQCLGSSHTGMQAGIRSEAAAMLYCQHALPVSGPWELVHNDVAGTLAKPAMPGAPTPTAWIADPATGLTRQADSPRYGTTRCDTRSLPASGGIPGAVPGMLREIRGLLEARSVARFALWSCAQ
ncbi:hypothetical protein CGC21_18915 [Leishmania donovani]|uniref:Uncharacterized protein n=1 Tax=Leishmania donovani TaxID=5661 RepID=A0A504XPK8_LEIDO|nr:hypothetical protein CGC21_18915 [Leishmania donovani]